MTYVSELKALFAADDLRTRQAQREAATVKAGVDAALSRITDVATGGASSVFTKALPQLIDACADIQLESVLKTRRAVHDVQVLGLEADQLAGLFYQQLLRIALDASDSTYVFQVRVNTFATRLGRAIETQVRFNMLEAVAKGMGTEAVGVMRRLMESNGYVNKSINKVLNRFEREFDTSLSGDELLRTGLFVTEKLLPLLTDSLQVVKLRKGKDYVKFISMLPAVHEALEQEYAETVAGRLSLGFMICEPRPLAIGELDSKCRYMTLTGQPERDELVPSASALHSLNATQAVPYSINTAVLDVLKALNAEQVNTLLGIEADTAHPEAMVTAHASTLESAEEAAEFDKVYFPGFFDFRGRQYQATARGLSPQGSEVSKGLLKLPASDTPLGEDGMWYLWHELGNVWGYDKDLLDAKVAKAQQIDVVAIAEAPLTNLQWLEADEPTKALAVCMDIAEALATGSPETYVSQLILNFDGSCNGMQHLSLLVRDTEGAAATNVTGDITHRADFYGEVAERVMTALEGLHSEEAEYLKAAGVKGTDLGEGRKAPGMRKIVKRGVMTIPYGATHNGLAKQFLEDNMVQTQPQANLMRDLLVDAMSGAAPKAMEVRQWLTDVARELGKGGIGTQWETPNGSIIAPRYNSHAFRVIRGLRRADRIQIPDPSRPTAIQVKKHVNGIVPNVIHSFDAVALQDTVCALLDNGVTQFSFIHDSFGVTAGNAKLLNEALRTAAADMYKDDVLGDLYQQFQRAGESVGVTIAEPPALGDLDVTDVIRSPYFFA